MFIEVIRLDEFYFASASRLDTEDTLIIHRSGKVEFSRHREDRSTESMEWKIGMEVISLLSRLAHASNFSRFHKSYMPPYRGTSSNHVFHLGICMEDGTKKSTTYSFLNSDTPASLVSLTKQIIELSEVGKRVRPG